MEQQCNPLLNNLSIEVSHTTTVVEVDRVMKREDVMTSFGQDCRVGGHCVLGHRGKISRLIMLSSESMQAWLSSTPAWSSGQKACSMPAWKPQRTLPMWKIRQLFSITNLLILPPCNLGQKLVQPPLSWPYQLQPHWKGLHCCSVAIISEQKKWRFCDINGEDPSF